MPPALTKHSGTLGNDTLLGDSYYDWFFGSQGKDFIDGGDGSDTIFYSGAGTEFPDAVDTISSGVIVNLSKGTAVGGAGHDTFVNIEHVVGSDFEDLLIGDAGDNSLSGGKGTNTYDGGGRDMKLSKQAPTSKKR